MTRPLIAFLLITCLLSPLRAAPVIHNGPHLLLDANSGEILAGQNLDARWVPASLTKLMTAYVTLQAMRRGQLLPDDAVIVSRSSLRAPPSKMGFPAGTVMTVDTALKIILIKSANDIAIALAEAVAGSELGFVERMNLTARQLGLTRSRFVDPNGLSSKGQYTTARDMAILAYRFHLEFPETWEIFAHQGIRFGKKRLRSYNAVLGRVEGADGMKTGFVCASGYNIVASATRDNRRLIAVVLGAESIFDRAETAAGLLQRGFVPEPAKINLADAPVAGDLGPAPPNLRPLVCREGGGARSQPSIASVLKQNAAKTEGRIDYALSLRVAAARILPVTLGGARGFTGTSTKTRVIIPPVPRRRPEPAPTRVAEQLEADSSVPELRGGFIAGVPQPNPGRLVVQ